MDQTACSYGEQSPPRRRSTGHLVREPFVQSREPALQGASHISESGEQNDGGKLRAAGATGSPDGGGAAVARQQLVRIQLPGQRFAPSPFLVSSRGPAHGPPT